MTQQFTFSFPIQRSFKSEDYFINATNKDIAHYIHQWPAWPHFCSILYGATGSGKSHLGHIYQERSQAFSLNAEELETTTVERLSPCSLLIDDLPLDSELSEKQEENLFHLYNWVRNEQKTLLILTHSSPANWRIRLPDLRSRLRAATLLKLPLPDDDLLTRIYIKLFADHQLSVSLSVISYLVKFGERSFTAAYRVVEMLSQQSLSEKKRITISLVREAIKNI